MWLLARATSFHLITTLREMCDHHGLQPGGVFTFTRDVVGHRLLRAVIHPRHNGYHLTHHLLPAVPYYRLPQAHALLRDLPIVRSRGHVCDAYLVGAGAVVRAWERSARR
jgi:fatty acid desaturase